jgi:hypothetical protein
MLISIENDETKRAGLEKGDVVVAVYGFRVHDFRSYKMLRDIDDAATLDLILWRAGVYTTLSASPPNKHFGVNFADYRAQ